VSKSNPDRGVARGALIALLSLLLGAGAAAAAVAAVISSSAPDDRRAVQTGPRAPVDPAEIITYGG
jgi:hypothetical protein